MKNIQDVLREKEAEIEKLTRELKLLRVAARMLEPEGQNQTGVACDQNDIHPQPVNGDIDQSWP